MAEDKHEKAIDLTEKALEELAAGNEQAADELIDQAKKIDPTAPEEVVKDMEEDAASRE